MIHVGIDLEFADHNCTQIMVEINHFFIFKAADVVLSQKLTSESPWQEKLMVTSFTIYIHWLHQDQFLVSKILTGHVTNFITPPIVIIYHGALLLQVSTP